MDKRRLGRSDLMIAPLMFGGNVFGWSVDEKAAFTLLDAFLAAGFNAIDTADVYSRWIEGHIGGESEIMIGNWMKARGNRSKVIVATKFGQDMGDDRKGLGKAYAMRAVEASLKRLQTDYIDLYQSHRDDNVTDPGETIEGLARLVEQGKVRVIGASNFNRDRFGQALAASARLKLPRYETLQPLYNLYDRSDFEKDLQPLCVKEGIGVIPYFSLASGFLTGKYRSKADLNKSATRGSRVEKYLNDRGLRIVGALDAVAKRHEATPAQIALAWLMGRPGVAAPIASATSVTQLEDILKSTRIKLAATDVAELDTASA